MFFDFGGGNIVLVFTDTRLFFGKREGTAGAWGLSDYENSET